MNKEVIVISLGGSQILKNGEINTPFLLKFKKIVLKYSKKKKFVIVTGGGSIARTYINGLKKIGKNEKLQSYAGISITRHNARFMSYFFGDENEEGIPHTLIHLGRMLKEKNIIFCGALEYKTKQTTDATSAKIASHFNGLFINITNVAGLYTSNPLTNKNAKLIPYISWKDFHNIVSKIDFKPGQHFVLDQTASKTILNNKIKTFIIGNDLRNLDKLLQVQNFKGTTIYG